MPIRVGRRRWRCWSAIEVAQAVAAAGVEPLAKRRHERAPRHAGPHTAEQLVPLAGRSVSRGRASTARAMSWRILGNHLQHTRQNLAKVERERDALLEQDTGTKGRQGVQEFGPKTRAALWAERGDVERFAWL